MEIKLSDTHWNSPPKVPVIRLKKAMKAHFRGAQLNFARHIASRKEDKVRAGTSRLVTACS